MAELRPDYLYSTSTLHQGRFRFNQVRYQQHDTQPNLVVLVGWDTDRGVFIWTVSGDEVSKRATTQAALYSLVLPSIDPDHPPPWLGQPQVIPKRDMESAKAWVVVDGLAPHPKRNAILSAVEKVYRQVFLNAEP